MTFSYPLALALLLLIPLAVGGYVVMQKRRSRYAVRFTNLDLLANVVDKSPNWRRHVPPVLSLAALALLLMGLARPEITTRTPKEQATVVLVTDISGSMNATDVAPTRLGAAEQAAQTLLAKLPAKVQVSLISFSSSVQVLVPPTTDRKAVTDALSRLRPRGGTAMGDALTAALDLVRPPEASLPAVSGGAAPRTTPAPSGAVGAAPTLPPAFIVLLSDGAQTLGTVQPLTAADDAKARGVPVFTIALGTPNGVAQVQDNQGRLRTVRVPPDVQTLQEIADITGGRSYTAPTASDLNSIYADLGSKIGYTDKQTEITWLFAGLGAMLIVVSGGLSLAWFNRFP